MSGNGLRQQLQDIYDKRGTLTPALVVAAAKPESSPLHHRFEWNDKIAGPLYRLNQASHLIREVTVTKAGPDHKPVNVRAFHAVRSDGSYEPADVVASNSAMTRMLLAQMQRDWQALKDRYANFNEFWLLVGADVEKVA